MSKRERVSEQSLLDHARTVVRRVAAGAACEVTVGGKRLAALPGRRAALPSQWPSRFAVPHADTVRARMDRVFAEASGLEPMPLDPLSIDPERLRRAALDATERRPRS